MKVVIAAGIFPPEPGGPATYAKTLADELPKRGIDAVVVPFRDVRHHLKIIRHIAYAWLLVQRGRDADVIFAQDTISVGLPARFVSLLLRKPLVVRTGGDYAWEQAVQRFGVVDDLDTFTAKSAAYGLRVRMLRALQTFVARGAVRVIAPSQYLRRIIATWGIPEDHISVVYSAFVPESLPESREALREKYGMTGKTIVSAGRLVPWKGMRLLLEVMATLVKEMSGISLVVISDGPEGPRLKKRAQELGLVGSVKFLGAIAHTDVLRYFTAADLFVLNTGYEGLSYHILEAMSCGTPVVTTPVGGNPELIENGIEGTLVPYNDKEAFVRAIRDSLENDRSAQIAAAREKARSFSAERMITDTINVLNDVCLPHETA